MTALPGVSPSVASLDGQHVSLTVDESLYALDAIYGAAYVFIDRCYVVLDRPADGKVTIVLSSKRDADEATLRGYVGEFANELLSQAYRARILTENRALIEAVTTQALAGAMGPPSLDDLQGFDFSADGFEDPLGIATSWEDKYKKKPSEGDGGER
jgi:His-Xaa-Ser system protein HxsD